MCPLRYYPMLRQSRTPSYLRLEMVRYAQSNGIKAAARTFHTTVRTVRKWLRRFEAQPSLKSLEDQSRAPHQPHRPITPADRNKVIRLKKKLKSFGAARLKRDFELSLSERAICRIFREAGLLRRKRHKPRTKSDLREVKRQWRLFAQVEIDTKDLDDIPELWPQIQAHRLPLIQYTAREVVSGWQFIAFSQERALAYSALFAEIIIQHLLRCGVDLFGSRFQTDNGSEFIGSWHARHESSFTRTIQAVPGLTHQTIPPGAHTWQADVETAHRLIEDELYEVERFTSRATFLAKARAYNIWFNVARRNSYKGNLTPAQIIRDREPSLDPRINLLPPLFLDRLFLARLDSTIAGGYHVGQVPFCPRHPFAL